MVDVLRRRIATDLLVMAMMAAVAATPTAAQPVTQVPAKPASAPAPKPTVGGPAEEARLRTQVRAWRDVPYRDNGTTRSGIGNSEFVNVIVLAALGARIPSDYGEQRRTGKLVERKALAPGDLVFFEGVGIGPFRSRTVGVFLGKGEVALARKEEGVTIVMLSDAKWSDLFKTGRRILGGNTAAPIFDVANYGSNREGLLRDIAKAWSGTLYQSAGTTFSGIGNEEFVREVYGAIYETDLVGEPRQWATMGRAVARDRLEPGDIILYDADPFSRLLKLQHAGIYIGNGEFVAAVRGSAVTILELNDARWKSVYRSARRIDPDAPERAAAAPPAPRDAPAPVAVPHTVTDHELRLRSVERDWDGTPYKLGGSSKSGIDCSAFSRVLYQEVYKVELPRTAEEQEGLGIGVARNRLEPGDLIFFRTQGMGPLFRSRHVGVYLGGGEFAQASGRHGVTISRLDEPYWSKRYHSARRVPKT